MPARPETKTIMKTTNGTSDKKKTHSTATTNHDTAASAAPATAPTAAPPPTPAPAPAPAPALVSSLIIPTEAQVAEWVSTLEGVRAMLGDSATPLTSTERRHALRARKGGETTVGLMATLGKQYDVQLPGIDPNHIQQTALLATRLQPLETKLRVISGLVTDTVANAKTESWQGTTSLYSALLRASKRDASLQQELKPAVEFFKASRNASPTPKGSTSKKGKGAAAAGTDAVPPPTEAVTSAPVTSAPVAPAPVPPKS